MRCGVCCTKVHEFCAPCRVERKINTPGTWLWVHQIPPRVCYDKVLHIGTRSTLLVVLFSVRFAPDVSSVAVPECLLCCVLSAWYIIAFRIRINLLVAAAFSDAARSTRKAYSSDNNNNKASLSTKQRLAGDRGTGKNKIKTKITSFVQGSLFFLFFFLITTKNKNSSSRVASYPVPQQAPGANATKKLFCRTKSWGYWYKHRSSTINGSISGGNK